MKSFDELSPTFCTLPWIHLSSTPDGRAKICCIAKSNLRDASGKEFSFEKNSIKEIWNSPELISVRAKMLAGEKVSECRQCYSEEELGGHSMRLGFNEKWLNQEKEALLKRVKESERNNHQLESMPWYYDLRQGNLCNLKCRSCSPENSISIEKEYIKIAETDVWFKRNIGAPALTQSYRDWFENESFNSQLLAEIPNIKKLYFTGGEPTLIEKNYELLKKCVDSGYAGKIELMFNTNLTNMNSRFLDLIQQFKHVMLNLSVEGYGIEQEYLRGNSKWSMISANLEKLASLKARNIHLLLTPVIQACNVLTITKLFTYIEGLNEKFGWNAFHFMPIILNEPRHLDMVILPMKTRQLAAANLEQYLEVSKIKGYDRFFETRIRQVIARLNEPSEASEEVLSKFLNFTATLDKQRGQSFAQAFPDLYSHWRENSSHLDWSLLGNP